MLNLNSSVLSAIVAGILSYGIEKWPTAKRWWEGIEAKEPVIYLAGLAIALALLGLRYAGAPIGGVEMEFGWEAIFYTMGQWVSFVLASQATYVLQGGKDKLRGHGSR